MPGTLRKIVFRPEFTLFVLISIFLLPLCGLIFQCGCTHLWSGADSHCNIHDPGKPDCPWCIAPFHNKTLSLFIQIIPFAVIFVSAAISIRVSRSLLGSGYMKQLAAGIVGGSVAMVAVAWIYGRIYNYPFFFFK